MGHVGFDLANHLVLNKKKVIGIYNKSVDKYKKKILQSKNITIIKNDIDSQSKIEKIIKKYKVNTCIFCSGVSHENYAKKDVYKSLKSNVLGIYNILELQKKKLIKKVIYISTGSVFQSIKSTSHKINESTVPTPNSLYSGTKRMGEILISAYRNYFKCNATVVRISWVYGPPIVVKKFNAQRGPVPYILFNSVHSKKRNLKFEGGDFNASFTYIEDVSRFINHILKRKKINAFYHLGNGKNYKNHTLGKIVGKELKKNITFSKGIHPWSNDSVIRGPIISSDNHNFKFKFTLEKGVKKYLNWIKNEKR